MSAMIGQIKTNLKAGRFEMIFKEVLGWNRLPREGEPTIPLHGQDCRVTPLAEKGSFKFYLCTFAADLPAERVLKQLDRELDIYAVEHMTIFTDARRENQAWLWTKKEPEQPARSFTHWLRKQNSGERLARQLDELFISIKEEEEHPPSLTDIRARVNRAFNIETVTKTFYEKFKEQHEKFLTYIENIADLDDRKWYTSLMLNRLMFIYFIQKQRILDNYSENSFDGDKDYLRHRLEKTREKYGPDNFYAFYRHFLLHLFHDGLNTPEDERDPGLEEIIGRVRYLNGGIFDIHHLEEKYRDIQIGDEAFEQLFDLFDKFDWTLDDRAESGKDEINPDVLGYIFEKYINQKQMGAYYTKEDITGYISKNTIIPFLFESVAREHPEALGADGPIWSLLRDGPDDYIYDAIAHGRRALLLPEIEAGISDVAKRGSWNQPADRELGLPRETWREVMARRQRYDEVRERMLAGEINAINDLITYNLNITRFAGDVIENCDEPALLAAFYNAIRSVTVLDPTCGSGAFLFAALNILKPLYHACIKRMRALLAASRQQPKAQHTDLDHLTAFENTLRQVDQHPNQEYFILKTIIVNNLYGVDIMEEASEICKLRLFLKLVAQVTKPQELEPLPDIDFNILAGNTLIGFTSLDEVRRVTQKLVNLGNTEEMLARIEQQAQEIERAEESFRAMQTKQGIEFDSMAISEYKRQLREKLDKLRGELDPYLATEYGIDSSNIPDPAKYAAEYANWQKNYHPFHWWMEFYRIMQSGGFDVIIGNPPYVEYEKIAKSYKLLNYKTLSCGNLYALTMERCSFLVINDGRFGMIVPASASCTDGYIPLQKILLEQSALHISSFSDQRGKLFDIPHPRLCIIIYQKSAESKRVFTTAYMKLGKELRGSLFERLEYVEVTNLIRPGAIPRYSSEVERIIHTKLLNQTHCIGNYLSKFGNSKVYYTRKLSWFVQVTTFIPSIVDEQGQVRDPSELKTLQFSSPEYADFAFVALNSNLFYWFITVGSDCRNLNMREVLGLPFDMSKVTEPAWTDLKKLSSHLTESLQDHSEYRKMSFKNIGTLTIQCMFPSRSKAIVDEIDRILAQHYSFTDEELDFIINYDIKYRMGRENGEESEE